MGTAVTSIGLRREKPPGNESPPSSAPALLQGGILWEEHGLDTACTECTHSMHRVHAQKCCAHAHTHCTHTHSGDAHGSQTEGAMHTQSVCTPILLNTHLEHRVQCTVFTYTQSACICITGWCTHAHTHRMCARPNKTYTHRQCMHTLQYAYMQNAPTPTAHMHAHSVHPPICPHAFSQHTPSDARTLRRHLPRVHMQTHLSMHAHMHVRAYIHICRHAHMHTHKVLHPHKHIAR